MLRKGARDKRGLNNRHMGTLSISVHEDEEEDEEEGTTKPSSLDVQHRRWVTTNGGHAEENCSRDLGHINKSLACTLYSLYMYICTYI